MYIKNDEVSSQVYVFVDIWCLYSNIMCMYMYTAFEWYECFILTVLLFASVVSCMVSVHDP